MKLIQLSIDTTQEAEDALSDLLIDMGSGGVQTDYDSFGKKIILTAYFPLDDNVGERVYKIERLLEKMRRLKINTGKGSISINSLDDTDWTQAWKSFFKPLPIGERILVYPSWEDVSSVFPDRGVRDILIQIDSGMAFGTGRHSTTIVSLELLEKAIKGGEIVADIGTGSGILAIAAAKLGAKKVIAVDIEPRAVEVAKANCELNGVSNVVQMICGDLTSAITGKFDILVSNILTKILIPMLPDIGSYLNRNSLLILSGILDTEVSEIENSLANEGLRILQTISHEEWVGVMAGFGEILR